MATKELSVADKLKQLVELQTIDSKKDEIKILKGELPMEVSDLEDEIIGLQTRVNKVKTGIEEVNDEINKHTVNIKEAEALIERYNSQLDNVKNNREYDALTKELELQKLEIQLSEKRIREANTAKEVKEESLVAAEAKLAKRTEDLETKKVELDKIIAKTEKDEAKLEKASTKVRKLIEDRLIQSYDKIRTSYRNGVAVAPVNRASCGGCFNRIPPQTIIEIGSMKNIIACEHCGRVLVDPSLTEETKK